MKDIRIDAKQPGKQYKKGERGFYSCRNFGPALLGYDKVKYAYQSGKNQEQGYIGHVVAIHRYQQEFGSILKVVYHGNI